MDARRIVIVGRFGRRLFWCALGATLALGPGAASAQCSNTREQPIPDCQNQPQGGSLSLRPQETRGWVFSCTGGSDKKHLYFYHFDNGFAVGAVDDGNNCLTSTEQAGGKSSQFVGSFTNTCGWTVQFSVALACSDTPQPPSD
jgi:hypothetical protein